MLNLKHLYYFHIFSQELSTGRAAKRLGITSPALSNQLKSLESYFGASLTERVRGKIEFTEFGESVAHYTEKMFSTYEDLKTELSINKTNRAKTLRVGICKYLGPRFSFDLLTLFEQSNLAESQNICVDFDSSDQLLKEFEQDSFDLALGAFGQDLSRSRSTTFAKTLAYPVRLFSSRTLLDSVENQNALHALSDPGSILKFANAKKIALIIPTKPSVLRAETDLFLSQSKVRPLRVIECNSSGRIVQLIERGLGLGFAPTPCLLDFRSAQDLAVMGPKNGYWTHEVSMMIKKSHKLSMTKMSDLSGKV